jgi:hypothetical protein
MPTPTVINKYRFSDVINRRYWDKYFFSAMNVNPVISKVGGGAAAGASGEVDTMNDSRSSFEYLNIVGNTNIGPKLDGAFGLNLAADATSTHGVEYDTGITPQNPYTFTIDTTGATQPAFFLRAQFSVATIGGVNPLLIGFRKLAARNATLSSYTDFVSIGVVGTAGEIETQTNIASAGVITTDTTQAVTSATEFQLVIYVDAYGNVTYELNGVAPTVTVPYQFANGTVVMPFLRVVQSTTTTATASCNYFECGLQS